LTIENNLKVEKEVYYFENKQLSLLPKNRFRYA